MARYVIFISLLLSFFLCFFANKAQAINTFSKTYHTIFVYPYTFDNLLKNEITNNPDYYNKFDACAQLAAQTLASFEGNLRQRYSVCPDNPTCTKLAKDIEVVMHLKNKIGKLIRFIRAKESNAQIRLLDSDIGRDAIYTDSIFKQQGVNIINSPVFKMEISILDSIPCQ